MKIIQNRIDFIFYNSYLFVLCQEVRVEHKDRRININLLIIYLIGLICFKLAFANI